MARNSASSSRLALSAALVATALLSGCNAPPEVANLFNETIGKVVGVKLTSGPELPKDVASGQTTSEPESSDNRALNAEFIREMHRVVLLRDVRSREEFDRYMNVLDQGGHYESIYNGIVYAGEYREKEKGVAPVAALKAYTEVLAQIQLDQKYDPLKIKNPADASGADQPAAGASGAPQQPTDAERIFLQGQIEKDAITKSIWFLKRQLGEETLKTIDLKKEYREKLATWYGRFSVALNKRGVDFGIPLRNKQDEYFHYKWALDADEDRLKWECLNRVHRMLNAAAGLREPVISPVPQQQGQPQSPQQPASAQPAQAPGQQPAQPEGAAPQAK